jgi:transposase
VKSRRAAGGQPGHPGHHRELVPVERVDAVVDLTPDACRQCARRLHARHTRGDARRHQVTELPRIAAYITEYRCHRRQCPDCGTITLAQLPDEHATQLGPQLTALIAYLTVVCRMPRLVVQRFLEGALQIPISLGSTQNAWEETSAAVAAPYAELEGALRNEPVINADETGHRTNGDKWWLWTFVARTFVPTALWRRADPTCCRWSLGETFAGILGSDRLPAYLKYVVGQRQFCWAHVTRNLLSAVDLATTPAAKRFCREALALDRRLFRLWHRFRGDPDARGSPLTRAALIAKVLPIYKRLFALGERHLNAANAEVRNLAYAFFVHHQHFFTFVHENGVAPTNNSAERALRTAVQWRKIMFGTRSEQGERAVERLLTIVRTCQLQQLNALAYLTAAIAAHRRRQPVESLLKWAQPH